MIRVMCGENQSEKTYRFKYLEDMDARAKEMNRAENEKQIQQVLDLDFVQTLR